MHVLSPPLLYSISISPSAVTIGTAIAVILYLIGLGGVAKKQTWAPFLIALTTIGLMVVFVHELSTDSGTSFNALVSGVIMATVLLVSAAIVYREIRSSRRDINETKKALAHSSQ